MTIGNSDNLNNSFAGSITGSGNVTKAGTGTLILTGSNSYVGTNITAGTLQVGYGDGSGTLGTDGVTDNATLVFNRADTITVSNTIGGNGTLTQAGTGSLILTGSNSYVGTTITAGTLQVGSGSTSGTLGTDGVTDNATLVFNRSNALTVSNTIGGNGTLVQAGSGTLILTGSNSYVGTTITAGTLQVGSGSTSGTLGTDGVTDNATLVFNRSGTFTVSNTIGGTGTVAQASTGTLILISANTYTGNTTISAGTLQVGNGTTVGTLGTGTVTDNAALAFNHWDAVTVGNNITGSGSLIQAGTGTLILTGSNSYVGTTITAGTLQVGNGDGSGTLGTDGVTDNAALVFNRADTLTVGSVIGGNGTLTQAGSGTLILTGASTYTGGSMIASGTVLVGVSTAGNITSGALGTGTVTLTGSGGNASLATNGGFLVWQSDYRGSRQHRQPRSWRQHEQQFGIQRCDNPEWQSDCNPGGHHWQQCLDSERQCHCRDSRHQDVDLRRSGSSQCQWRH